MSNLHCYVGMQNLNLNTNQRNRVFNAIKEFYELVQIETNNPSERLHSRVSIDGTRLIYEALFDTEYLKVNVFKQFIANEFDIDVSLISHELNEVTFSVYPSLFYNMIYNDVTYFRIGIFGGVDLNTVERSRNEVLAYMSNNPELWESN